MVKVEYYCGICNEICKSIDVVTKKLEPDGYVEKIYLKCGHIKKETVEYIKEGRRKK